MKQGKKPRPRATNRGAVALLDYFDAHPDQPQWKVAEDIGVTQPTMSRWRDGVIAPGFASRRALAAPPYRIPMELWDERCEVPERFAERAPVEPFKRLGPARERTGRGALAEAAPATT